MTTTNNGTRNLVWILVFLNFVWLWVSMFLEFYQNQFSILSHALQLLTVICMWALNTVTIKNNALRILTILGIFFSMIFLIIAIAGQ